MALNTVGDIITEILVRNNRTTTDGFITDLTIQGWVKDAHTWAAAQKKWPMTEGKYSTTTASTVTSLEGYTSLSYPENWKSDSVRLMTVGGKRFYKKNFYKFQSFFEDNPSDTSKLFTDFSRQLLINPNASDFSGTIVLWGQYGPLLDVTDFTALTIFSNTDEQGNEALVEKSAEYLKRREHLEYEAQVHGQTAKAILEEVSAKIGEEQFAYQDTLNEGIWKRFDVTRGGFKEDIFRRDQWGL